jgi:DNA (cytosine-5)-methyltransferase 1
MNHDSRKVISLFTGVGGFDLGALASGCEVVGMVEIDKNCQKVLKHQFPDVPLHDDIRTAITWAKELDFIGKIDIVCGGFPCQDVSIAGKRAGIAGARSGLFWEALEFTKKVQAHTLILENVPGLLSSNDGRDFAVIISALANAGLNHIEWRVLDSQFFGVPQRRKRIFIVATSRNRSGQPLLIERKGGKRDSQKSESQGQEPSTSIARSTVARMRGFGDYAIDEKASALKARDYKDVTDIVVQ